MSANSCDPHDGPAKCTTNMGEILLKAGDLVSAYRYFQPLAEAGEVSAIDYLIEICVKAGDAERAEAWRSKKLAALKI
jgi:TPR repeat protein